jgi:hypothetical protein
LDADTRARLISLGQDPDKVAEAVAPTTTPTLADHIAALAALVNPPPAAPVAPPPPPLPVVETPAPVEAAPAPAVVEAYRPIEQVYTPPAATEVIVSDGGGHEGPVDFQPVAADAVPVEAPAAEPVINYSPSGQYIELLTPLPEELNPLTGAPYGTYVEFANDPQVAEFKKNGTMATQVDGNHYVKCAIQPLDYIMANKLGFVEGNIVKYATRWQDKDGVVDLKKARDYLDKLIAYVEAAS